MGDDQGPVRVTDRDRYLARLAAGDGEPTWTTPPSPAESHPGCAGCMSAVLFLGALAVGVGFFGAWRIMTTPDYASVGPGVGFFGLRRTCVRHPGHRVGPGLARLLPTGTRGDRQGCLGVPLLSGRDGLPELGSGFPEPLHRDRGRREGCRVRSRRRVQGHATTASGQASSSVTITNSGWSSLLRPRCRRHAIGMRVSSGATVGQRLLGMRVYGAEGPRPLRSIARPFAGSCCPESLRSSAGARRTRRRSRPGWPTARGTSWLRTAKSRGSRSPCGRQDQSEPEGPLTRIRDSAVRRTRLRRC